jgi:hypothetical protein
MIPIHIMNYYIKHGSLLLLLADVTINSNKLHHYCFFHYIYITHTHMMMINKVMCTHSKTNW